MFHCSFFDATMAFDRIRCGRSDVRGELREDGKDCGEPNRKPHNLF
jgi:hypothetical protein